MSTPPEIIKRTFAPNLLLHGRGGEHAAWKSARDHALLAYRVWSEAAPRQKREAYVAYVAAADREAAATDHMHATGRACVRTSIPAETQGAH